MAMNPMLQSLKNQQQQQVQVLYDPYKWQKINKINGSHWGQKTPLRTYKLYQNYNPPHL